VFNFLNVKGVITLTPQEIKANLILKGITQASIAKKLGVTESLVSMVIHGKVKNSEVRKAIAKAIGKPVREIFPKSS
jgi:transcriptional regulator with XRE-family HTH domain